MEARVGQLRDEHRRHAVERRAALVLHRAQGGLGVERRSRDDHGRTVRGAGQVPEHHPEAVVEGHRDADPVPLVVPAALTDEVAVVEDVVVGEGGALGEAGGAAGVLDVDGVVELELALPGSECDLVDVGCGGQQRVPLGRAEEHDLFQRGESGTDLGHHGDVVTRLELLRRQQQPAPGLRERVGHLMGPVGRVEVDQDGTHPRRGVLDQHPLGVVRAPDPNPVALFDAQGHQPSSQLVHGRIQLGIREPYVLERDDEGLPVAEASGGGGQVVTDGLADQRHRGGAVRVRQRGVGRHRLPPVDHGCEAP